MELPFPSFPILFTFLLFLFMVFKIVSSKTMTSNTNMPPGPWKLPLIGNMHQFAGSQPHHCLRDLARKHGPLMHLQLGELSIIVISSAETAKEVLKTHDITFADRPYLLAATIISYGCTDIAFAPYGDYWRQLRKICILELLSAKRVQSFRSIREEEVSNLIKSISSQIGSPLNLSKKFILLSNGITSRAVFGKKCQEQEAFSLLVDENRKLAGGFDVADLFPSVKLLHLFSGMRSKLEKIHRELDRILVNIIDEHKAKKVATKIENGEADEDLVDVLLKIQEHGDLEFPLTINNIKSVILDLFIAGTDTSSTAIEWAMSEMLKNPRVMEKAQAEVRRVLSKEGNDDDKADLHELSYLKLVIKETLRLHPPAPLLLPRECRERCKIKGYEIPVKSKVIVNAWAIGRDPQHWIDPESFSPERFLDSSIDYKGTHFQYIPFGAGRRICPGISFAIANIELQLTQLLYHFDWKLVDGDLDMTEAFGSTVKKKTDLYVVPTAYHPSPGE